MATHKVTFQVPERPLGQSDIEFLVREDGELLGRVLVSQGAIDWAPARSLYRYRLRWARFAEKMEESGWRIRRKGVKGEE
ncbi:MAG: hypothetical protein JSV91_07075 [Phycisphaerales bacterium]|nr:MAG: hypothetical protein JSV91_07075 [Phycisphaerales bacterium]